MDGACHLAASRHGREVALEILCLKRCIGVCGIFDALLLSGLFVFSGGGVLAAQIENGMETVPDLWREHAGSGHSGGTELSGMSGTYFCWVSWKTGNRESSESDGYTGEMAVLQRINE